MKIYALRDRLLNYFLPPFVAPEDNQVKASLANVVNSGDPTGLAQAPQHFELWRLGEVTPEGHVLGGKELLCDCHALIRAEPAKLEPGQIAAANGALKGPLLRQQVSPGPAESSTTQVP